MILSRLRGTLFRKYAAYFAGLVSVALLASGVMGLYFAYRDTRALVEELQREKARGAASRIQLFVITIENQLKAALLSHPGASPADFKEQYFELLRLLRQALAVVDVAWFDVSGLQRMKISRLARDELSLGRNRPVHPGVAEALRGKPYVSPVYFRQESEPYMTVAVGSERAEVGVVLAEVNLKFVWEVVSAIKIGATGYAYVIDSSGRLISHPDISLVLSGTDLSRHVPVREVLAGTGAAAGDLSIARFSADGRERRTLTAHASIPTLGWHVLVEQPLTEAFAPLYASAWRSGLLFLFGIVLAVGAGVVLARRMTAPIRSLQEGATRIGEGRLQERVEVSTGDELETLADQFNRMAERLRESYAGLEQKIEERTRQLAAANRAKSRFLAAASHDLRQPVHALGLYVAQLHDAKSAAVRQQLLGKIEASAAAVSELLEALLDISKLDVGGVTPQPTEFTLQPLLSRLEANFSISAQAKNLRLRLRPSPLRVATDPMLLERILMNLVANAVRYTREGGVLVGCRRRGRHARIEVWDTGVGIAATQQERIFEEFYQAHALTDETSKGLGLGLAIVERLARLLELRIDLRSKEGGGSMFAVEIPLSTGPATAIPAAAADPKAHMRFDGAVALVLDDDADAREAAAGLLAQWGWRVISCGTGDEALTALDKSAPSLDAIISDYRLARDELGTQVIRRIRAAFGRKVPAVVVSGDVTVELQELARREDLHLLYKPLQAAKLRTLLHHLLHPQEQSDPVSN
jgi:signal transduction histidine kinase